MLVLITVKVYANVSIDVAYNNILRQELCTWCIVIYSLSFATFFCSWVQSWSLGVDAAFNLMKSWRKVLVWILLSQITQFSRTKSLCMLSLVKDWFLINLAEDVRLGFDLILLVFIITSLRPSRTKINGLIICTISRLNVPLRRQRKLLLVYQVISLWSFLWALSNNGFRESLCIMGVSTTGFRSE